MRTKTLLTAALAALLAVSCNSRLKDGEYSLTLLTTNDIHGHYFDSTYTGDRVSKSLFAVNRVVDSVRTERGADRVILVDAGSSALTSFPTSSKPIS